MWVREWVVSQSFTVVYFLFSFCFLYIQFYLSLSFCFTLFSFSCSKTHETCWRIFNHRIFPKFTKSFLLMEKSVTSFFTRKYKLCLLYNSRPTLDSSSSPKPFRIFLPNFCSSSLIIYYWTFDYIRSSFFFQDIFELWDVVSYFCIGVTFGPKVKTVRWNIFIHS